MKKFKFSTDKKIYPLKEGFVVIKLAEDYFGTHYDKEQAKITKERGIWIHDNLPDCLNIIKCNNEVIGFTFILPATKLLMKKFIMHKINEEQLFKKVQNLINFKNFETLYLCSAFIKPEFRGKGLATKGFTKSIKKITKNKQKPTLFYWAYSKEGNKLALKIAKLTKLKIKKRN